jgi:1,4-alpha-glucan branching enzyme
MVIRHADGAVEFVYFRPGAVTVRLVGDFSGWHPLTQDMRMDEQGWWRLRMSLPPGEYRFKYLVDADQWEADFAAYGVEPDRLGGWNSVLWIDEPAKKAKSLAA